MSSVSIRSGAVVVTGTNTVLLLGNAVSSGHAYRVVGLRACNTQITATTVTVTYVSDSSTGIGTGYSLVDGAVIAGHSYIDILDTQHPCHLEENTSLAVSALNSSSTSTYLLAVDIVYSYEDIS
jgi:hypothetical protein